MHCCVNNGTVCASAECQQLQCSGLKVHAQCAQGTCSLELYSQGRWKVEKDGQAKKEE